MQYDQLPRFLDSSIDVLQRLRNGLAPERIEKAIETITASLATNKVLLVCGNGGSACDSMHIAGELVGRFLKDRRALKAIALSADPAVITAWANDKSYDEVFEARSRPMASLAESSSPSAPVAAPGM